jgi:hypothetical protein
MDDEFSENGRSSGRVGGAGVAGSLKARVSGIGRGSRMSANNGRLG